MREHLGQLTGPALPHGRVHAEACVADGDAGQLAGMAALAVTDQWNLRLPPGQVGSASKDGWVVSRYGVLIGKYASQKKIRLPPRA